MSLCALICKPRICKYGRAGCVPAGWGGAPGLPGAAGLAGDAGLAEEAGLPEAGVAALVDFMREFERTRG